MKPKTWPTLCLCFILGSGQPAAAAHMGCAVHPSVEASCESAYGIFRITQSVDGVKLAAQYFKQCARTHSGQQQREIQLAHLGALEFIAVEDTDPVEKDVYRKAGISAAAALLAKTDLNKKDRECVHLIADELQP